MEVMVQINITMGISASVTSRVGTSANMVFFLNVT